MRFYGDHVRTEPTLMAQERLESMLGAVERWPDGVERHAALVGAFIEAARLLQGVADAEMTARGYDDLTPIQAAGMDLLLALANEVAASWRGDVQPAAPARRLALEHWRSLGQPSQISTKAAEGYAHYAVYPEAYLEAGMACSWSAPPLVVGLRSIGAGLATMVAVGAKAQRRPLTVRPGGSPFARQLNLSVKLRDEILDGSGPYAVVDEGPGLSGSSFGAIGDVLQAAGIAERQVVYFPSHDGDPGPCADLLQRRRWSRSRRVVADFDGAALGDGAPIRRLDHWISGLIGPLREARRDLSGGNWRRARGLTAPATPGLERRKFLYQADSGAWLAKFAGLGEEGAAKARQASALAAADFTPRIAGLRHGFLVEAWLGDAKPLDPARYDKGRLLNHLARYLAFRGRQFPAGAEDGASTAELMDMTRVNASEALGAEIGAVVHARLDRLATAAPGRPMVVDGRLHAWEWLCTADDRLLKTDAVDHARGHDLVGCQDVAWDLAGAQIELDLSDDETRWLARAVERLDGGEASPGRLAFQRVSYVAFQLALWSHAQPVDTEEGWLVAAHTTRYRQALLAFAGQSKFPPAADPRRPVHSNAGDPDGRLAGQA